MRIMIGKVHAKAAKASIPTPIPRIIISNIFKTALADIAIIAGGVNFLKSLPIGIVSMLFTRVLSI